jgi:hypothetical protein
MQHRLNKAGSRPPTTSEQRLDEAQRTLRNDPSPFAQDAHHIITTAMRQARQELTLVFAVGMGMGLVAGVAIGGLLAIWLL